MRGRSEISGIVEDRVQGEIPGVVEDRVLPGAPHHESRGQVT